MARSNDDVAKTLKFGTVRRDAILLAIFVAVGPFAIWKGNWFISAICVAGGFYQLYKVLGNQAGMTLSPKGIDYSYDGISYSIPWREISAVEMLDPQHENEMFRNVTALTISRAYYDAKIHNAFGTLLNPNRSQYFEIGDGTVRVAVYSGFFGIERPDLFPMIEKRWKALAILASGVLFGLGFRLGFARSG